MWCRGSTEEAACLITCRAHTSQSFDFERAFSYLLALLLCPHHLLIRGLKLSNKVMFAIGVPVPNRALAQKQKHTQEHVVRRTATRASTHAPTGLQRNAMLND